MNEQKQLRHKYFNPNFSDKQQSAEHLSAAISWFLHSTKLKPADWIASNHLLKQLKKSNDNLPRKVLRSIENKFEKIRESYQR